MEDPANQAAGGPSHHWLTLHRCRFDAPRDALKLADPREDAAPEGLVFARLCPSLSLNEEGFPTLNAATWGGFAVFDDLASAEAHLKRPQGLAPALAEAVESWHALALPVSHVGEVNWRGQVEQGTAIRAASRGAAKTLFGEAALAGPMAVLTSAGFESIEPDQMPRIRHFLHGVMQVMAFYRQLPDNLRRDVFTGHDIKEGCTMTLWPGEKAMIQAAYGSGRHRELMDKSRDGSTFDRSSFTRALLIDTLGSWEGDPLAGL